MARSIWLLKVVAFFVLSALAPNVLADHVLSQEQNDFHLKNEVVKANPEADALYKQVVAAVDQHQYSNAIALLEKLANMKITEAYVDLGNFYIRGLGVPRDVKKACGWWQKAADEGNADGYERLGWAYDSRIEGIKQDRARSFEYYFKGADLGNPTAMAMVGTAYEHGTNGLERDEQKAANFYKKSAEMGDPFGENSYGRMFADGKLGVQKNPVLARIWLRKAAYAGLSSAMFELGEQYFDLKDYTTAMTWYKKAANNYSPEAYIDIAFLYDRGLGVKRDHAQSVMWARKAIKTDPLLKPALVKLHLSY